MPAICRTGTILHHLELPSGQHSRSWTDIVPGHADITGERPTANKYREGKSKKWTFESDVYIAPATAYIQACVAVMAYGHV